MKTVMSINDIAKAIHLSYQTVQYRANKLFGRSRGVFDMKEVQRIANFHEVSNRPDCTAKMIEKSENSLRETSGKTRKSTEVSYNAVMPINISRDFEMFDLQDWSISEIDAFFSHWDEQPFEIRYKVIQAIKEYDYD